MSDHQLHAMLRQAPLTGVAIPVATLRSTESCGIGEFLDLRLLGEWCAQSGLSMIQILPVNDTGSLASPYSAVSAFALHPAYIRLERVPGTEAWLSEIETFRTTTGAAERVDMENVLGFKLDILHRTYQATAGPEMDAELDEWAARNPWVRPYAVYKCLKGRYEQKSWVDWPAHDGVTNAELDALWHELRDFVKFFVWLQLHLDRQFTEAVDALHKQGIYLKGDIPILMNVDSADVWAHRDYFDLYFGAGAPPDMFTRTGQTWGFPIYRWEHIQRDGFGWWNDRLRVASKYYDAFRIDHVIGFFRIWSQPAHERTAVLGHYEPSESITREMLRDAGFSKAEIRRLVRAWTTRTLAENALGVDVDRVLKTYFAAGETARLAQSPSDNSKSDGNGDATTVEQIFELNDTVASERLIDVLTEPHRVRDFLFSCHRDRSFIPDGTGAYYPTWYWDESKGLASLDPTKKQQFKDLIADYRARSRPVWMHLGRQNLVAVRETTDMLACAEDLGAVPDGLRDVLEELGILSLKIERWEMDAEGGYLPTKQFPFLSVSTPSVHDLATLRVWWEEDDEHESYFATLGLDGDCPEYLTVDVAEAAIRRNLESASAIVVFQIQDLFALTYDLRVDPPSAERVNVPGTIGPHNWSYRLPVTIEDLLEHEVGTHLRHLVESYRIHEQRPGEN